jgi:aflatoxin B1 aldehyde reductase
MTFGPDESAGARVTSLDDFNKCLDLLQKQGYYEVDTAEAYVATKQQAFTAEAKWKERGLKLATKYYPKGEGAGHTPDVIRQKLEWNLEQLKTDCVDIFYLHAPDRSQPFEPVLEECNKMHKEGKFVELGLSNYTAFEVAEIVMICNERGWVRPTIYQGMYNAISRFGPACGSVSH